jgi:hypothetical protein
MPFSLSPNAPPAALPRSSLLVPAVLFVDSVLVDLNSPPLASWITPHTLLVRAAAWAIVGAIVTVKTGVGGTSAGQDVKSNTAWVVGGLLVLAQICEKSVEDHGGREILLAKVRYGCRTCSQNPALRNSGRSSSQGQG